MSSNLLLHFRPRRVPEDALRFTLTWGLGGMAALMVVQQLVTGLLLGFLYEPLPVLAFESVQHIQNNVFLGRLVRNMHHWTGHVLIVVVFLHLLRVFLNGAFCPPRQRNWLVGLGLAVTVLMANFSGYLLPWDQLSYWAVTIATSMLEYVPLIGTFLQEIIRGGVEVEAATLQLFYSIHTTIVPVSLLLLMAYHFWFVRRADGVLVAGRERTAFMDKQKSVPASELLVREVALAAVVTCFLLLFSMFVDAPLGDMANPQLTPETVKAPWYFLGAQELLLHVHPVIAVCVLPLFIALFLIFLPFGKKKAGKPGALVKTLFIAGVIFLLGLTVTGIWFRGPGMKLVWPW
ncbi:MAG: cytochrome bc complex cytochrome b subunit [Thermodesulfobacteriota bacterium]|nr:cytochrome bc complex cytochrome b subunit [Thermodesulfobacteriota bacterium]